MKIFNLLKGDETKNINSSLPVYRVEWKRIIGEYRFISSDDFKAEKTVRFFTDKEEAYEFYNQLKQAFKLLETENCDNLVLIKKEKDGGL